MSEVNLTAGDIQNVVAIIDTVSGRGAFKGEELEFVGAIRNKFNAFLQTILEQHQDGEKTVDGDSVQADKEEA